jgi:acyl-CoA oxidase
MRDTNTRKMMPGVKAGDLGPKMGGSSLDNGWVIYSNVRIPRTNMMSRFVSVSKDGEFEMHGDLRAVYAVLINTR